MIEDGRPHVEILIVEDDYLIAQNLEDELTEAGFSVLGPAGSVSDAMAIIDEGGQPDAAILDVNLGDDKLRACRHACNCWNTLHVCHRLRRRGPS